MIRAFAASVGGMLGGSVPLAAEKVLGLPVSVQIAISATTGTVGALAALYAFAMPRRECVATHAGVTRDIGSAKRTADEATVSVSVLRAEFSEFRGEVREGLKAIGRIEKKLDRRPCAIGCQGED